MKKNLLNRYFPIVYRHYSPYDTDISFLYENWDLRAKWVNYLNKKRTQALTGVSPFTQRIYCRRCIYHSDIPNVYINRDRLCNMCVEYERNFSLEHLQQEVKAFTERTSRNAPYEAVMAFSGGKDSTACLYNVVKRLRMKVIAILVDNGFIPNETKRRSQEICDRLGVPFKILDMKQDFKGKIRDLYESNFDKGYPCHVCSQMFKGEIVKYCKENHMDRVILGRNFWAVIDPVVSSIRKFSIPGDDYVVDMISLPFALRVKEPDLQPILDELGWVKAVGISGNSTNCRIPGLVESKASKKVGFHPETVLIGGEVIAEFLSRERGLQEVAHIQEREVELHELVHA